MFPSVRLLLAASATCAGGVYLSRNNTPVRLLPGSPTTCNNTVVVPGSAKPLPALGHIPCCNLSKMINQRVILEGAVQYLRDGGRLLETSPEYGSEATMGDALNKSGVPREEVWVHTKVAHVPNDHKNLRRSTVEQVRQSLERMGLDYVDVVSIKGGPTFSMNTMTREDDVEMWRGLLDAKEAGLVRVLGLYMHTRGEIEHITSTTGVAPQLVPVFVSPFHPPEQLEYLRWLQSQGIAVSIYGFLRWNTYKDMGPTAAKKELHAVQTVGSRHSEATVGQVLIRWALDQGVAVATDMSDAGFREEDLHCLGPEHRLGAEDLELLDAQPKWTCLGSVGVQALPGCVSSSGVSCIWWALTVLLAASHLVLLL